MKPTRQYAAFRDLLRGADITLHTLHMFGQVLTKTLGLALFFFALSFVTLCYHKLETIDWYMMGQSVAVRFKIQAMGKEAMHVIRVPHHHPYTLKAGDFLRSVEYRVHKERFIDALYEAGWQSLLFSGGLCLCVLEYFRRIGKQQAQSAHSRLGEDEDPYRAHPLSPKDGSNGLCSQGQAVASKRMSDPQSPFEAIQSFSQSKEENL
jgi:hypothetical protein